VVEHLPERLITAAGVSSGIDMAIRLVEVLFDDVAAQAAQMLIEYDPQPPFDAGHPSRVGTAVMERAHEYRQARP
jgi:transcriptional regulator GlxA family with amidase domain